MAVVIWNAVGKGYTTALYIFQGQSRFGGWQQSTFVQQIFKNGFNSIQLRLWSSPVAARRGIWAVPPQIFCAPQNLLWQEIFFKHVMKKNLAPLKMYFVLTKP